MIHVPNGRGQFVTVIARPTPRVDTVEPILPAWYLTDGLTFSDVSAAYKAIGASSYAASLVNLARPGTNDATKVTNDPAWNASTGWTHTSTGNNALNTSVVPDSNFTMLVRFSNASGNGAVMGKIETNMNFLVESKSGLSRRYAIGATFIPISSYISSGIMGISQYQPYLDGTPDGSPAPSLVWSGGSYSIYLGGDIASGTVYSYNVRVLAAVIYNKPLDSTQMAAITSNMAALS